MRRRGTLHTAAAALAAALALSACQSGPSTSQTEPPPAIGGGDIDATPRASDSPSAGATEAGSDDWTPPDPITEEYLLRVLTSIEADLAIFDRWLIDSEANEEPTEAARSAVARALVPGLVENFIQSFVAVHSRDPEARSAKRPYGQYRPVEVTILRTDVDCPLLRVTWDSREVAAEGSRERSPEVLGLVRATDHGIDNEGGWLIRTQLKAEDLPEDAIEEELESRSLCP